ncbi:unnamed protein product [Effrenium voratum]|nr:unnamed protein product [Effrenium voratum]
MSLEDFVRRSVGCRSVAFQNERTMGFSGATVSDVLCKGDGEERLLFLKVVAPEPLADDASAAERQKWERNLQSYANELAFLSNPQIQEALARRGVLLPKTLGHTSVPGKSFALLTENLQPGFASRGVPPAQRFPEVLRWLANFHGAFQSQMPTEHGLWDFGTHVHLDRRPAGEIDKLPEGIASFCKAFEGEDDFFRRPAAANLGSRLQQVASTVSRHLTIRPENLHRMTLVHGDFKGANYFLKCEGEGCTAIDWQWTGPGVGATDLIYLLCGSVEDEIVENYQHWLKEYHKSLGLEDYPFKQLELDFKAATLDYARWVFAYRLLGDSPEKFRQRAEKVDENLGIFRRHVPRARWLLALVEEFLPEIEGGALD